MNITLLVSFAVLSFAAGLWMRQRRQRPPAWQRWLQEAIRSYEGRKYQATIEQSQKAVKAFAKTPDAPPIYLGLILFYQGRAQLDLSQYKAAESTLQKSQKIYQTHPPEDPMYTRNLDLALGDLYFATEQPALAHPYFSTTLQALLADETTDNAGEVKLVVYQRLAELEEQLRRYAQAIEHYQGFLEAFASVMGEDHPAYQRVARHRTQLIAALAAQTAGFPDEQISLTYPGGEQGQLRRHYAQWLVSPHPQPNQESLLSVLKKAKSVMIGEGENAQLFQEPAQLGPLKACFRIEKKPEGHKLIATGLLFDWLDEQGNSLARILHLGNGIIRWPEGWKDDAELEHPPMLAEWLEKNLA